MAENRSRNHQKYTFDRSIQLPDTVGMFYLKPIATMIDKNKYLNRLASKR